MSTAPLAVTSRREGRVLSLRLARPKANIIDAEMIEALHQALASAAGDTRLKALLLCAEGPHFSFGASVEEHLPEQCAAMLEGLHRVVMQLVRFPVPVLVAVQGQCLGAGLEVAMTGHLLFAAPNARLGQPEIKLGVFAPAASCLLPLRMARMAAEDILLSGRSLSAEEGHRVGLVAAVVDDPQAVALAYYDDHLAASSASSLRFAVQAAREDFSRRAQKRLAEVEALYLERLMATADAVEGLTAFIAKRPPAWKDQ
ncbi:MAG: cyclohexa-1,5-dienecarbonyl-CoA hydratase [Xanthomonadales bacterium]|nr:cyclohexa-1,5-dienecarbonyl-CoA hydratase [Xanthomonadales bacterium]